MTSFYYFTCLPRREHITNRDSRNEYVDVYKGSSYREYYNLYTNEGWKTVYSGKIKKGQKVFVCLYGGIDDMYKIKIQ